MRKDTYEMAEILSPPSPIPKIDTADPSSLIELVKYIRWQPYPSK